MDQFSLWDRLARQEDPYGVETRYKAQDFPKVSIIVPTQNAAQVIRTTLDSIFLQDYPNYEVIIIDCSSDRTLEIIRGYQNEKIRIYSIACENRYLMLNKGLSQADGEYVCFLFPGDYYIYPATIKQMMILALDNKKPDLVYCGTLLRDGVTEVKMLYRELSIDLLKKGQQPTSLQSSWFLLETLKKIGKFDATYKFRGGLDILCRLLVNYKGFRFASVKRVFIDYDLRSVTRGMIIRHFWDTMSIVFHYFGFIATLRWFFYQKDIKRFFILWFRSLKVAFSGR